MKVIIDRFEGNYAVCEKPDRTMINIDKVKISRGAKEGDVLNITRNKISINIEETKKRSSEIEELSKDLWK